MRNVSLFHLNICFHPNNFNDLQFFIQLTNMDFGFISISDSRINKNKQSVVDINFRIYICEFCPTELSASGTLVYVRNHFSYKFRKDLSIFKSYELESTFIKNNNPKKTNTIIGCIYNHPVINLNELNKFYLNNLLDKLSKEKTAVFLIGDFNINLLNLDQNI